MRRATQSLLPPRGPAETSLLPVFFRKAVQVKFVDHVGVFVVGTPAPPRARLAAGEHRRAGRAANLTISQDDDPNCRLLSARAP